MKIKKSLENRFLDKVQKRKKGCWNWTASVGTHGYGQIAVDGTMKLAHRVSYELYVGLIPTTMYICHKCDNIICVRPDHLFLGTEADISGAAHGSAKLNNTVVKEIRELWETNLYTQTQLSKKYSVCVASINAVIHNRYWKHVR